MIVAAASASILLLLATVVKIPTIEEWYQCWRLTGRDTEEKRAAIEALVRIRSPRGAAALIEEVHSNPDERAVRWGGGTVTRNGQSVKVGDGRTELTVALFALYKMGPTIAKDGLQTYCRLNGGSSSPSVMRSVSAFRSILESWDTGRPVVPSA